MLSQPPEGVSEDHLIKAKWGADARISGAMKLAVQLRGY